MAKAISPARRRAMGDAAGREIQRKWGDTPVVDATEPLRVIVQPEDAAGAKQKDPARCGFARACQRLFGATKVQFHRTVAFVELPDEDGNRRVERFMMGERMRDVIAAFDKGEGFPMEGGFVLRPPQPGRKIEYLRVKNKKYGYGTKRHENRRPRVGPSGIGQGKGKYRDEAITVDLQVRNGSRTTNWTKPTDKAKLKRPKKGDQ